MKITLVEPVNMTFAIKYMAHFVKAASLADKVSLSLSPDVPIGRSLPHPQLTLQSSSTRSARPTPRSATSATTWRPRSTTTTWATTDSLGDEGDSRIQLPIRPLFV